MLVERLRAVLARSPPPLQPVQALSQIGDVALQGGETLETLNASWLEAASQTVAR